MPDAGGRQKNAGGARGGHAAGGAAGKGDARLSRRSSRRRSSNGWNAKEQTMLFLNRRGYATSLQCPLCGYVAECPDCSVALTYHRQAQQAAVPYLRRTSTRAAGLPRTQMPQSGHPLRRAGDGEGGGDPGQAVSAGARAADGLGHAEAEGGLPAHPGGFPDREDRHTGRHANDRQGAAFPNVTLVGIIHADLGLHMPDFRGGRADVSIVDASGGPRRARRGGRGGVCAGLHAVSSRHPIRPPARFQRFLRAGNGIPAAA